MSNHPARNRPSTYPVEVQSDFLEKITRAKPVQALAEFIWNSLDADASRVDVFINTNALGVMSDIIVRDNGTGMEYEKAPELFQRLGGSWKRAGATTKKEGRFLHGQDGRGRFKAFTLGRIAEWNVVYKKHNGLSTFSVLMNASNMKEVSISEQKPAEREAQPGVTFTISELHKEFRSLTSDAGIQELTEMFALYLADYKDVAIVVDGKRIDPSLVMASQGSLNLSDVSDAGKAYPVRLDIIEWKSATNRALYLCGERGLPLAKVDGRFHVGSFQFSAYVKSSYVSKLQKEGTLELSDMNSAMDKVITEAQTAIKDYFRERAAKEASSVVQEWKDSQVYPYKGEATSRIEEVERQVFDIVAVTAAQYLTEFSAAPQKNKALHLRLLRQAMEKSPEELQLILGEVLKLPKRKQEELAELLRDVSLSSIISAAKIVADRLRFLTGLDAVLFDTESKKRLKERSQLHRIIEQNCWLFGEEYNLSVDDKSLTEVLRKHRELLGDSIAIDEPVKHPSKERGIVDLMLSRSIRHHKADDLTHLVVELKAPKIKVDRKEITQIEEYARAVTEDERFRSVGTTWMFWVISDDYGDHAEFRMKGSGNGNGKIYESGNVSIWVKTWAQVLDENRARLQFFQERFEYEADKGASLQHLQEKYAHFLEGVLVEEGSEAPAGEGSSEGEELEPQEPAE